MSSLPRDMVCELDASAELTLSVVAWTEVPSCRCLLVTLLLLFLSYCLQCSVAVIGLCKLCMQGQDPDEMALFTPS